MRNFLMVIISVFICSFSVNANLIDRIKQVKPAVVGVGLYTPMGSPKATLLGSGFLIGHGNYVVTNFHVVPSELSQELKQDVTVFIKKDSRAAHFKAEVVALDEEHDLAILAIKNDQKHTSVLTLGTETLIDEGVNVAFTGFPIGSVLGLYPVTHQGIVAAITPTITPVDNSKLLNVKRVRQLQQPFMVYQLDATAYPGNSGSALYNIETGDVVGIINKVFVQESKESLLKNPSGITYAIPVKYLHDLLKKNNITL